MNIKSFIIDIDGVLYEGKKPVPGADKAIDYLQQKKIPFVLLTNTTMKSPQGMAAKLKERVNINVLPKQILTASSLSADYIRKQGKPSCFVLVAKDGMKEFNDIPKNKVNPHYVIVGDLGLKFNYDVLNKAFRALWNGAELIAMQNEPYEIGDNGPALDVGAWVALLEKASGKKATVIAKPSEQAFLLALNKLKTKPEETAMIGDTLMVDIYGAKKAGLKTILVKTGRFVPEDLKKKIKADYVLPSFEALPKFIESL